MASKADVAKRRARVVRLRAAGMTCEAIAEQESREDGTRQRSPQAVSADFNLAMADTRGLYDDEKAFYVHLEIMRLDRLQRSVEQVLRSAQSAACPSCGRSPEPSLVLRATDRQLRIAERRSMLLALDAPKRQRDEGPAVEDELAKRRRQIREMDAM